MKKGLDIDWNKVKFIQDEYELVAKFSPKWSDWVFVPIDFLELFDEMLEEEIKKNVQARRLCYSWDSKTGWTFDSKKLRKPLKSIFKTTHETN